MKKGTLEQIVNDPVHTHCVLEYEDDARSVRIAADQDLYELIEEETAVFSDLYFLSDQAAALIQGGMEEMDEDEPVRILHARCGGEDVTVYLPDSW